MTTVGGEGGLSAVDILRTRREGFFRCELLHFFCEKKNRIFRNLWCTCVRNDFSYKCNGQGERGVEPVPTFCEQVREGKFFTILYGRALWTALNLTCCAMFVNTGLFKTFPIAAVYRIRGRRSNH